MMFSGLDDEVFLVRVRQSLSGLDVDVLSVRVR